MILLRKCYVARIGINKIQYRKSITNIYSYSETICSIRNTRTYVGFPRHIISSLFQI